jgi:uncharacterized membrane protein YqaE (UPF0057 family)
MRRNIYALLVLFFVGTCFMHNVASAIVPVPGSGTPDSAAVKTAVEEFKTLSRSERKFRIKQVKEEIRAFKAAKKAGRETDTNTILLVILAILLPPLAVYLHQGEINTKFWISLLLTLLFWLPGVVYALIVILGNG